MLFASLPTFWATKSNRPRLCKLYAKTKRMDGMAKEDKSSTERKSSLFPMRTKQTMLRKMQRDDQKFPRDLESVCKYVNLIQLDASFAESRPKIRPRSGSRFGTPGNSYAKKGLWDRANNVLDKKGFLAGDNALLSTN